jgi:hypothetical protein
MGGELTVGTCGDCRNFVAAGPVSPGKEGNCVREEKDQKGGIIWYSKPVRKTDTCRAFQEKEKESE